MVKEIKRKPIQNYCTMKPENGIAEIRPYSTKELAALYQVDEKTFRKWIKVYEIPVEKKGYHYMIPAVIIIFERLGYPKRIQV
jgi:hypothetical protein